MTGLDMALQGAAVDADILRGGAGAAIDNGRDQALEARR
jgi:hypothetical protein